MSTNKRSRVSEDSKVNNNYIGDNWVPPTSGKYLDVTSPHDGNVVSKVAISSKQDVETAAARAKDAFPAWSGLTVKARAAIMYKFHTLMQDNADELADLVVLENGKNKAEALAAIAKGNETVEYACSLPQLIQGKTLMVSRGVTCQDHREPLGVIGCIVPFNFPVMVPLWTIPITLTAGNCVIVKPSEKVPSSLTLMAKLLAEAGVPPGVFQVINGQAESVNALCDDPRVDAVTFVGSSRVAELVSKRCRALNKRVLALGGAKNHLVALPDCDTDMAAQDIVASFSGCAGQRCMAASVLLLVGEQKTLMDKVIARAGSLKPGQAAGEVGPVIDKQAQESILNYINKAEESGSKIPLDGRSWAKEHPQGSWVGPTIILCKSKDEPAMMDEIFGPVLSVFVVDTKEEAIEIENANKYGNAACVYTSIGANAEWFSYRFSAGMIGVNIGIPVPREPFSFGGTNHSKFGDFDITGDGLMEFCTRRRKITTKWTRPGFVVNGVMNATKHEEDKANFDGQL